MKQTTWPAAKLIDVTGLPEEAVKAMESLVTLLRAQPVSMVPPFPSPEDWIKAIREWAESHKPFATQADWSRESIYAGRGE